MAIDMFYNRAAALEELYKVDEEEIKATLDELEKKIQDEVKQGQGSLRITITDQREEYLMGKLVSAIERGGYKLKKETHEFKNVPSQYIYTIKWVY